jgi:CheY-like chemotaxis protein
LQQLPEAAIRPAAAADTGYKARGSTSRAADHDAATCAETAFRPFFSSRFSLARVAMERRVVKAVYGEVKARCKAWARCADVEAAMTDAVLTGRTILVVEDDGLIARELADALESAGAEIITARGVFDATRIIESRKLSAAVLDFWLGVGVDCLPICALLTEQHVPFLLYTSYTLLEGAPNAPILGKPAPPARIIAAVADLIKNAIPIERTAS